MRSLIKLILILLVLTVIVVVGGPFVTGIVAQKKFNEKIAALNNDLQNLNIKIESSYKRGFFNSLASTDFVFTNQNVKISLEHNITHGPVLLNFKGFADPTSYIPQGYALAKIDSKFIGKAGQKIDQLYKDNTGYTIITILAFDGKADTMIKNAPLVTAIGHGQVNWQGLTGDVKVNHDASTINSSMKMPLIEYTETDDGVKQQLSISGINFGYAYTRENDNIVLKSSVDNLKIIGAADSDINLNNITFVNSQTILNNLVNLDLDVGFTKLDFDQRTYGPLAFSLQFKNLDASIYRAVMDKNNQAQKQFTPQQTLDLLHKKPTVDLDFKFNTNFGDIIITVKAEIGSPDLKEVNKEEVLKTLNITKHWQVNKKLVYMFLAKYGEDQIHAKEDQYFMQNKSSNIKNPYTMTPEQLQTTVTTWIDNLLQQLAAQNLIVMQDDNVIMDLNFANNVLTINGVQKTPEELNKAKQLLQISVPGAPTTITGPGPVTPPTVAPATAAPTTNAAPVAPQNKQQPGTSTTAVPDNNTANKKTQ